MASGTVVSTVKQHNVTIAGVSLKYCQYLRSLSITLLWASEIVAVCMPKGFSQSNGVFKTTYIFSDIHKDILEYAM